MKKPRRMFRIERPSIEPDVHIVPPGAEKRVILSHVGLDDLQGYLPEIRSAYWDGVKGGGYKDPFVFVIHRMSDYAKANSLADAPNPLGFCAVTREGAVKMGLIRQPLPDPVRPPMFEILLATGSEIQSHVALNSTETDVIDMIRVDPTCRPRLEAENPGLKEVLDENPGWFEGY